MQFQRLDFTPGEFLTIAQGPIVAGDLARLGAFLGAQPPTDRMLVLFLDSPGGDVLEAERIASAVARSGTNVAVSDGNKCVSACFLIFAAGRKKSAAEDALIGVHSVSEDGAENMNAMGLTTAFARDLAGYGVPPAIIGKLVSTQPNRVEWLTLEDLRSMDVIVTPSQANAGSPASNDLSPATPGESAMPSAPMTAMAPTAPVLPPPVLPPPQTSAAFQQGLADRRAYEAWFNALDGEYQAGAFYWSGQRSLRNPGTCYTGTAAFRAGCLAARQMLSPSDVRRHSEPDYRAGWNNL